MRSFGSLLLTEKMLSNRFCLKIVHLHSKSWNLDLNLPLLYVMNFSNLCVLNTPIFQDQLYALPESSKAIPPLVSVICQTPDTFTALSHFSVVLKTIADSSCPGFLSDMVG